MENKKYKVEVVYKNLSFEQKQEIVQMWVSEKAVLYQEAINRVEHVACIIIHKQTNKIVAVTTTPLKEIDGKIYYTFGTYSSLYYRNKIEIITPLIWGFKLAINALRNTKPLVSPLILCFVENLKISHKLMTKKWGWSVSSENNKGYYINLIETV